MVEREGFALRPLVALVALGLFAVAPAFGDESGTGDVSERAAQAETAAMDSPGEEGSDEASLAAMEAGDSSAIIRGSSLIGSEVNNPAGDPLGTVTDLALNSDGDVRFIVLESASAPSDGEQLTAVPWDAVTIATDDQAITVDIDSERLAEAPHFSADQWPDMTADSSWSTRVESHFAAPPSQQLARDTEEVDEPAEAVVTFLDLDENRDEVISADEARQFDPLDQRFSEFDADNDGSLTRAEFSAFESEMQEPGAGAADTDGGAMGDDASSLTE